MKKKDMAINAIKNLRIKIFGDMADINAMKKFYSSGLVRGFTTNPTIVKKGGVTDYEKFVKTVLSEVKDLPVSFEVFSDDFQEMENEARKIAAWAKNVNIKIPIMNTKKESALPLIKKLSYDGMQLNITAVMTVEQVKSIVKSLSAHTKSIISVFCGRIADTGRDPVPIMREAVEIARINPNAELLWASSRELLNIFQAESCGCHIITVTEDILNKIPLINKDLNEFSLETVRSFFSDAQTLLKSKK